MATWDSERGCSFGEVQGSFRETEGELGGPARDTDPWALELPGANSSHTSTTSHMNIKVWQMELFFYRPSSIYSQIWFSQDL